MDRQGHEKTEAAHDSTKGCLMDLGVVPHPRYGPSVRDEHIERTEERNPHRVVPAHDMVHEIKEPTEERASAEAALS